MTLDIIVKIDHGAVGVDVSEVVKKWIYWIVKHSKAREMV